MECVYINLDDAKARRQRFEQRFLEAAPSQLTLERFAALGPSQVSDVQGSISPTEKACFCSHRAALEAHQGPGDLFILEDDADFTARSLTMLAEVLAGAGDWDVLFPEIGVGNIPEMAEFAQRYEALRAGNRGVLVEVGRTQVFSATAYVVREGAKARLLSLLAGAEPLNVPYDLFLRALANRGVIKAKICFPFLTTVAADADRSQIRSDRALVDETMNIFRRMMFVDRDVDACREAAAALSAEVQDETAEVVGAIFGIMLAQAFPKAW